MNIYMDKELIKNAVKTGGHRSIIGGLWDEIGRLQFDFLVAKGLQPQHTLLDIGCGSLRGGIHFVRYMESGKYYGIDSNQSLLDAGRNIEVAALDLEHKLPAFNLLASDTFEFTNFGVAFDFALAQSLFTHLPVNTIRLCLYQLKKVMQPYGKFIATYFQVSKDHPFNVPFHHPSGVVTSSYSDPFHYDIKDFEVICQDTGWTVVEYGSWNHPRDQHMIIFELTPP